MAKKFPDDELDEVLSKIDKFDSDGIRFIHLKNNVKKNFVKTLEWLRTNKTTKDPIEPYDKYD